MFAKISHKGLNSKRQAGRLHQMIVDGYHSKFQKQEKPDKPSQSDKEAFIEVVVEDENAILMGGFKYA